MRLVVALALTTFVGFGVVRANSAGAAAQRDEFKNLETEAALALKIESEPFQGRVALANRLQSAVERAPAGDQRGRLALLWLRAVRWLLAAVPVGSAQEPSHRAWLTAHETLVVYSEPAGEWLLSHVEVWKVHDAHRSTAAADDIAWLAVTNGYPGECEGYIPCYANILDWLHGEYLRRRPRGLHVSEAVTAIRQSLDQAVRLLAEPSSTDYLNPATDCGDLTSGLVPLREAVLKSNGEPRGEAVALIDRLLSRCP